MNAQYKKVVTAFETANGGYGKAVALLRAIVGNTDTATVKDATKQEKAWQDFLTSPEYKAGSTAAQDLMRKSMQRIRAKCGYTADRAGKISVKKTVARGTKARDAGVKTAKKLLAHSVANPKEAAKVISALDNWKTAIDAIVTAFEGDLPEEVKALLLKASFYKEPVKANQKA